MGKKKTAAEKIMEMAQKDRASNDRDCGMVTTVESSGARSEVLVQDRYLNISTSLYDCVEAPTVERKTLDNGTVYYEVNVKTWRTDGTLVKAEITAFMKK